MNVKEKTDKIVEGIRVLDRMIHMRHHEVAQEHNLSLDQFHLLIHLIHWDISEKSPTIGDIAKRSKRAQNTISERVTRLEEKGLLKRIKDEDDRRISRVVMTEDGIKLMKSINYKASNAFVSKALSRMDDDISTRLLEGLNFLVENLKAEKGDLND